MSVIAIRQLTKRYGRRIGVERISLNVGEGTLFGFLGPNGSGKTTTIRILIGLLKASKGSATVFGLDCWCGSQHIKAEVGYLPGDLRLYSWLTTRQAVRIVGQVRGRELSNAADELVSDFDLDPNVRVSDMSRGMRQKLGLILALVHRPQLLILDEPTTGLDPIMQDKLCERLRALAARGHTVFFSSHTLSEVERLCDRVAILREGRVVADETLEALRARAGRMVTITWQRGLQRGDMKSPGCLEVDERREEWWRGMLTGSVMELVRWCASQPIEDLTIGQPDLTQLFQRYYTHPKDSS